MTAAARARTPRDSDSHPARLPRVIDPVDERLRPQRLDEIVGQRAVAERLAIALMAARKRGEPLPHILFDGPPGLGKTTFATVLHNELGVELNMTSGAALDKKMDVMPYLTNAAEGSILFIDEIHRLPKAVEEFIYPVMEDFRVDVVLGEGMSARTINLPLKKFTIIGATTRSGMLSGPLRERFHMHEHLEFYDVDDLARIITINAAKLRTTIDTQAACELAGRSRGTPRIANARLRWVRDYAVARGDGNIILPIARDALQMQEIDSEGLDKQDRRYLETLIRVFKGGPDRCGSAGRHDERCGRHPERRGRAVPAAPRVRRADSSRPPGLLVVLSPPRPGRTGARSRPPLPGATAAAVRLGRSSAAQGSHAPAGTNCRAQAASLAGRLGSGSPR